MRNSQSAPVEIVLQRATKNTDEAVVPTESDFKRWAGEALIGNDFSGRDFSGRDFSGRPPEVCVRVVDNDESAELNQRYRGRARPANVLSFACDKLSLPIDANEPYPLGDIVIAAPLVIAEAHEQGKQLIAHWAHLFIHGMLHLQGYDHLREKEAQRMETREVDILNGLGFQNPYRQDNCLTDE